MIPTPEERGSDYHMNRVESAIRCLHAVGEDSDLKSISPRWQAVRARYLARASGLHWFMSRSRATCREDRSIDYLHEAIANLSNALDLVSSPELKRDRILSHQEMARVTIISAYGGVLFGHVNGDIGALFPVILAGYHLGSAMTLINSEVRLSGNDFYAQKDLMLLAVWTMRLRAYLRLLCNRLGIDRGFLDEPLPLVTTCDDTIAKSFKVLGLSEDDYEAARRFEIEGAIHLFEQIDGPNLGQRVRDLIAAFAGLSDELDNIGTRQVEKGGKKPGSDEY